VRQARQSTDRLLLRVSRRLHGPLLRVDRAESVPAHHPPHLPRRPAAPIADALLLRLLPRHRRRPGDLLLDVSTRPDTLRRVRMRYDARCYFNVRSKADMSQLNLPHGTNN